MKRVLLAGFCLIGVCVPPLRPAQAVQKPPSTYTIPLPPQPDYSALQWLMGAWAGKTGGKGVQGQVLLSLAYALGKRFLILREQVTLPATKSAPETHEGFMGIVRGGISGHAYDLALYSTNGFVTHYRISLDHEAIIFSPEGGPVPPQGWLFRRSIRRTSASQCVESVDAAPPGMPFFNYYTARLSRVIPGATSSRASLTQKPNHHWFRLWR